MIRRIFLDIETLPPSECGHPDCNGRDPCPDDEYHKLALKAERGRLLCVGIIIEQNGIILHQGVLGRDRATLRFHLDEAKTLRAFWKQFIGFDPRKDLVVGHNIYEFDLLFLYKRSVVHQVKPPVMLSFARYRSQPIFDTMKEWQKWAFGGVSLADLAHTLNLPSSKQNGLDGSKVYEYFMRNKHVEIAEYCLRDVLLTREIYYRMQFEDCTQSQTRALAKAS